VGRAASGADRSPVTIGGEVARGLEGGGAVVPMALAHIHMKQHDPHERVPRARPTMRMSRLRSGMARGGPLRLGDRTRFISYHKCGLH
jgi:hypothetical protein